MSVPRNGEAAARVIWLLPHLPGSFSREHMLVIPQAVLGIIGACRWFLTTNIPVPSV
ncbi:MAG: hypothetical protein HG425_000485 [Propionibacterium sp.]|nr:hypothetical protein [Propionibacterium sp.]